MEVVILCHLTVSMAKTIRAHEGLRTMRSDIIALPVQGMFCGLATLVLSSSIIIITLFHNSTINAFVLDGNILPHILASQSH